MVRRDGELGDRGVIVATCDRCLARAEALASLERLRASEAAAQRFQRGERGAWERRANAAEAHNERVAGLLSKYVVRNQLRVPSMPASILGAQQASELRAIAHISSAASAR